MHTVFLDSPVIDCGGYWRTMETVMIFGRGYRKIAEEIMIEKDKDTRGAIMIEAGEFLWFT